MSEADPWKAPTCKWLEEAERKRKNTEKEKKGDLEYIVSEAKEEESISKSELRSIGCLVHTGPNVPGWVNGQSR